MKKLIVLFLLCFDLPYIHLNSQNTFALVVGLSQYKEITPLQFADRDAVAFTEFLKTQNVPESNIKLYLNENANRLNILDGLYNLTSKLKAKDRFYFYFGGHGDLEAEISAENSLLLLYESFKKNYFQGSEFIQLFELKEWLGNLAKKQVEVVFIADACHSGGLIGGKGGINKTQTALTENWAGVTKILSCKSNELSLEGKQWGGGRGLFSYNLVAGLMGRADANKDKKISLGELDKYLTINVLKQANPNIQTPVIIGNEKQVLSASNTVHGDSFGEGLAKLEEMEQKNFALMTEVNTKGDDKKSLDDLAKLDTTIVETYKKFSKALKDKRIAPHDDSLDCALIHYRKLETYKLPDNLMQTIKRNMGVGLMQLELDMMRNLREKGIGSVNPQLVNKAVSNLEAAQNIFGPSHHIYKYLESRITILNVHAPKTSKYSNQQTYDQNRKDFLDERTQRKESLLHGLSLEPNIVSTHILLSTMYRLMNNADSAIYYQEKVVKLLPNQAWAYANLGRSYSLVRYKDANNRLAPHPKAIENLEKSIALDTANSQSSMMALRRVYVEQTYLENGEISDSTYQRNFPKAIELSEKILINFELSDEAIVKLRLDTVKNRFTNNLNMGKVNALITDYSDLYYYNTKVGNTGRANYYLEKMRQKAKVSNSYLIYWWAAEKMYYVFGNSEKDVDYSYVLENLQTALKILEKVMNEATAQDKPFLSLHYRQLLTCVGSAQRGLEKYTEAEKTLLEAINYPVLDNPAKGHLKLANTEYGYKLNGNRLYSRPGSLVKIPTRNDYNYYVDPYQEMFHLKVDQNKIEEAYEWYEKAMQLSKEEKGNDTSSITYTELVIEFFKNLDKDKILKIRYKYVPNAGKTKYE